MNSTPLISVVVPVYNVKNYIGICIDSILSSSFMNFELLLVDDGSTDGSEVICDEYAKKDPRVRTIHKQNGGVSSARNVGINNSNADWITFIDSDDFVGHYYLESLYRPIIQDSTIEFVHAGCLDFENCNAARVNQYYLDYTGNNHVKLFKEFRGLTFSKLYRLDLMKTIEGCPLRFDEKMKVAEDMAFTLDYILNVDNYAFVSDLGYYYRRDNISSITHTHRTNFDIEYYSAIRLYNAVVNYKNKYSLSDADCSLRYQQRADGFLHLLYALYRENLGRQERIRSLKDKFEDSHFNLISYSSKRRLGKFLSYILVRHHYLAFDIVMSIVVKVYDGFCLISK